MEQLATFSSLGGSLGAATKPFSRKVVEEASATYPQRKRRKSGGIQRLTSARAAGEVAPA